MLTLITGGARSGKSRHALELADSFKKKAFVATAQAFDNEMRQRIDAHQEERDGAYQTHEEPLHVARALDAVAPNTDVVVLDCLTLWMGNLMFRAEQSVDAASTEPMPTEPMPTEPTTLEPVRHVLARLDAGLPYHLIVVTNELGMGLVPAEPLGRAFRDLAGRLNQEVARRADRVILMVSGLPLLVKERLS